MPMGLPVSRVVSVSISLTPAGAAYENFDSLLVVGDSDVIDTYQRLREYNSIDGVGTDFSSTSPEYLASEIYFAQSPEPTLEYIGRWAKTATSARLSCGTLLAANLVITAWTGITNGSFIVTIDGTQYLVAGISFASVTNLNGVASAIQTALVTAGATGATVKYYSAEENFVVTSGSTGVTSTITFLTSPRAVGNAHFTGNPAANDTLTIHGTAITFVSATPTGNQVLIGTDAAHTLASLVAFLNASTDTNLSLMTYEIGPSSTAAYLYIAAKAAGTTGDTYTLATTSLGITVSGATLAGGSGTDISAMMNGQNVAGSGAYVVQGIAAETALAAVTALDELSTQWYGLMFAAGASNADLADSDILAIAAYVEASGPSSGNPHIFGVCTSESGALSSVTQDDIGAELMAAGYERTFAVYSSQNPYTQAGIFAKLFTVDLNAQNSMINVMWKQIAGVTYENLTATQASALEGKRYNYYELFNNGVAIVLKGTMAATAYIDEIFGMDALANRLQTDVFNLMVTTPTKIPQTDPGVHEIVTTCEGSCAAYVYNGFLAPGTWTAAGFGSLSPGDTLSKGYYVYAQSVASQSIADRGLRKSPTIMIAAKEAGAINTVSIVVSVNR